MILKNDPELLGAAGAWPTMRLQPWTFFQQTSDPAMDGDAGDGPNNYNNCGPETDCMILAHLRGIVLDADYVWDVMQRLRERQGEPTGVGYTTIGDSIRTLQFLAGIAGQTYTVDVSQTYTDPQGRVNPAPHALLWRIWRALTNEHPLTGLFSFTAPNSADGHFRAIIGMSPTTVITADPATGAERTESYADFWGWSKGAVVEWMERRRL